MGEWFFERMTKKIFLQVYGWPYVALAQDGAGATEEAERGISHVSPESRNPAGGGACQMQDRIGVSIGESWEAS